MQAKITPIPVTGYPFRIKWTAGTSRVKEEQHMPVICNQATLSYSGGTTNSNITVGQVVEVLTATKSAVSGGYTPGDSIAYVVSIVNSGDSPLTGLTVTDDLGGYEFGGGTLYPLSYVDGSLLYFVGGVRADVPTVEAGPPLVISGIDIPANSNVTLVYEAEVTEFAPLGDDASITNTAVVTGACPAEGDATVCMECRPELTISKSMCPDSVTCQGALTYTFVVQNTGCAEACAEDAVVISDTFDPVLRDLAVTLDDQALSAPGDYTYDEATGEFATVAGRITVPGATFTQNDDGSWTTTPGVTVLTVSGTL